LLIDVTEPMIHIFSSPSTNHINILLKFDVSISISSAVSLLSNNKVWLQYNFSWKIFITG
jgi:hypothetical protein